MSVISRWTASASPADVRSRPAVFYGRALCRPAPRAALRGLGRREALRSWRLRWRARRGGREVSEPRRGSSWPSVEVRVVDADTSLETLYSLVTSYICAAEGASALGDDFASARLFLVVSFVEEQIADADRVAARLETAGVTGYDAKPAEFAGTYIGSFEMMGIVAGVGIPRERRPRIGAT